MKQVVLTKDIEDKLRLRISHVQIPNELKWKNTLPIPIFKDSEPFGNVCVECFLKSTGVHITPVLRIFLLNRNQETRWYTFPVRTCDLMRDTRIRFRIYSLVFPNQMKLLSERDFGLFDGVFLKTGSHSVVFCDESISTENHSNVSLRSELKHDWLGEKFKKYVRKKSKKEKNNFISVGITLPEFSLPVVHFSTPLFEPKAEVNQSEFTSTTQTTSYSSVSELSSVFETSTNRPAQPTQLPQNMVTKNVVIEKRCIPIERDIIFSNPTQEMYNNLLVDGEYDKNAIPTPSERALLSRILKKTSLQRMSHRETQLLWKYAYWLLKEKEKSAIVKILSDMKHQLNKSNPIGKQLRELMKEWDDLDVHDGLELLSYRYKNYPDIRNYAIDRVFKNLSDTDLKNILLQLVQALGYEKNMCSSRLGQLLLKKCKTNFLIASNLYWYLNVERTRVHGGNNFKNLQSLLHSCINNDMKDQIKRQTRLFRLLKFEYEKLNSKGFGRLEKRRRLRNDFAKRQNNNEFTNIFPCFLPLDPEIEVTGFVCEKITIFKSGCEPILIPFKLPDGGVYRLIFKIGDDLRQDQLIVQIIQVLDEIFKKNALNLCLSPYKVLACDTTSGFVEFVCPSATFHDILYNEPQMTLLEWLEQKNEIQRDDKKFQKILDRFTKSCAGYGVITFVLGIGDRHLDNILIKESGEMFHIDWGMILGTENSARRMFSPVIKLSKDMIDTMKNDVNGYRTFMTLSKESYKLIRKHCRLFINMLVLMIDSQIEGVLYEGQLGTSKQFSKISHLQAQLKIQVDEKKALKFLENKLRAEEDYWGGRVVDKLHMLSINYFKPFVENIK